MKLSWISGYIFFFIFGSFLHAVDFTIPRSTPSSKINFYPLSVTVGIDSTQKVWVNGVKADHFAVGGFNPEMMDVNIQGKSIFVTGKKYGESIVFVVDDKGAMNAFMVKVIASAAIIPSFVQIDVTGKLSDDFIKNILMDVILQKVTMNEGAQLSIQKTSIHSLNELQIDRSAMIKLSLVATGNGVAESRSDMMVMVNNVPLVYQDDDYLLMCNTPEILTQGGLILSQDIKTNESIRLVYHHMNEIQGPPRSLKVMVKNPSQFPIRFFFNRACGGPHKDSLFVGHIANKRFMSQLLNKTGIIVTLPPGESYTVSTQTMWNGEESITGIMKLWLLQGKTATIEVRAYDFLDETHLYDAVVTTHPWISPDQYKSHVRGQFVPSMVSINLFVDFEKLPLIFNLGVSPNIYDISQNVLLLGNYGVIHYFNFLFENNTIMTQNITVSCFPSGGFARGLFWMNNELIETGILDPHKEEKMVIHSISLSAGDRKEVKMMTIPQAGSSYPLRLIIDHT